VGAFNLGSLLFQFINRAFPDPASSLPEAYIRESIRWSVSSLIVALPVFLYMSRLTNRAAHVDPNKRTSPVRHIGRQDLTDFLVMEYVEGDTLWL